MTYPRLPRRVWLSLLVPVVLLLFGTFGYKFIGGAEWSWLDAVYMTGITLTTVGFLEVHELSPAGRVFTIFLCFGGIFTLFYTATEVIRSIISGEFREALGREQMERDLAELRDHYVVCGLGRMGRLVCHQFEREGVAYVIIDRNQELLKELDAEHGIPLHGDATSDEVLKHAGIERARALVTVVASDADNLYITLSARLLNPKLFIVARAEEEVAEEKLRRVGANQVVAPYVIGGHRVAQAVLRPTVGHLVDLATRPEFEDFAIEELLIRPGNPLANQTLHQTRVHQDLGLIVVAIKSPHGVMHFNPQGDTVIEPGSILIAIGHRQQLDQLVRRAAGG